MPKFQLFLLLTVQCVIQLANADSIDIPNEFRSKSMNASTSDDWTSRSSKSDGNQPKSRHKRYVAFPEGSSFSIAACETIGLIGNPQYTLLTWSLNWGLAYDLPNNTWILSQKNGFHKFPKPIVQRRHRRDLYKNLENVIDNMGYNGRSCILRALCESSQFFQNKPRNMVEELIRIIFTLPAMKTLPFEHPDLIMYSEAHHKGRDDKNSRHYCAGAFSNCGFSLIALALGEYAIPSKFL